MMSLELLVISLVAWTFIALYRRDVALALLIVLVPVYQIRFTFLSIPTTLLELLIAVLVLVFIAQILMKKKKIYIPFPWLLAPLLLVAIIATIFSSDIRAGLGLLKAYIIAPMFVFVIFVNTIKTEIQKRRIEWAFITLIIFISIIGLLQWSGLVDIPEPYASEDPARATSVYSFPTAIGKLLGPLLAWTLAFILFFKKTITHGSRFRIIGMTIASVLGVWVLLVSRNRGALLGLVIAFVVALFFSKKKKVVFSVLTVCVLLLTFIPVIQNEVTDVFTRQDTSTDVRVVLWQGTWRLISAHPFTGAGLGGFPVLYDEYRDASHVELFPNPDNLFLTLWAELGILGLLTFGWLFYVWIANSLRAMKRVHEQSMTWVALLGGVLFVVALLGHGIVDTPYFKNDLALLFWMMLGFVVVTFSEFIKKGE